VATDRRGRGARRDVSGECLRGERSADHKVLGDTELVVEVTVVKLSVSTQGYEIPDPSDRLEQTANLVGVV
jgi:hypothetical protein